MTGWLGAWRDYLLPFPRDLLFLCSPISLLARPQPGLLNKVLTRAFPGHVCAHA